jgi:hypothetical protein
VNWNDLQPLLKTFRFAAPWLLLLLLLIPLWAWLRGRFSPVAAVSFSSGELLRAASRQALSSETMAGDVSLRCAGVAVTRICAAAG